MNNNRMLFDTTTKVCCICFDSFENGDDVIALTCGGHHLLCLSCCVNYEIYLGGREEEEEGWQFNCPLCRVDSEVKACYKAQNYYKGSGKTVDTAIEIDKDQTPVRSNTTAAGGDDDVPLPRRFSVDVFFDAQEE